MKIKTLLLLCVLSLCLLLRVIAIGKIPFGFANDEVNYLFSAYNLWHTGKDMHGNFLPFSFQVDSSLSPVPVYIAAPFVGLFGPSPATGRLPYAFIAVGTVLFTYLLVKKLFKNELLALISSAVLTINPWFILITRGAWDGVVAQFFYLAGLYIFIRNIHKGNILFSLPFFLLGFFSYHATKVFFVALVVVLVITYSKELLQKKKESGAFLIGCIGIGLMFLWVQQTYSVTRQEALIFNHESYTNKAEEVVTYERRFSMAPLALKEIFSNKEWFYFHTVIDQYISAFSPQHLFTNGDISKTAGWGVFMKGSFYIIEAPFMVLGLMGLATYRWKKEAWLLFALILISPLPSAFGMSKTYLIRGVMLQPFLSILIAIGILFLYTQIEAKNRWIRRALVLLLLGGYTIFFSRFLYQYTYQFSPYGSEYWNGSSRKLSEYIGLRLATFDRIIVSRPPDMFILHYGFHNKLDPTIVSHAWNVKWPATLDTVQLIDSCLEQGQGDPNEFLSKRTLYVSSSDCHATASAKTAIYDPIEPASIIWKIYEKI